MLQEISYSEYPKTERHWKVALKLGPVALLVGQNASGKSRTLAVIKSFAELVSGRKQLAESTFAARFQFDTREYSYSLSIHDGVVSNEKLCIDGETYLERSSEMGHLYSEALERNLDFQVAAGTPAVHAKFDLIQHPYLAPLRHWADRLRFYPFGTPMGRQVVGLVADDVARPVDLNNCDEIIGVYRQGEKEFPGQFNKRIVADMRKLGYKIRTLGIDEIPDVRPSVKLPSKPVGFYAQETGVRRLVWQLSMSQGMFRVLSLLIHFNYNELSQQASMIVIDDVGEGLDFERSQTLVKLLYERCSKSKIQLLMATNDRFIMNAIPLQSWHITHRSPSGVRTMDVHSHPELIQEYEDLGLSNFDFFQSNARGTGR